MAISQIAMKMMTPAYAGNGSPRLIKRRAGGEWAKPVKLGDNATACEGVAACLAGS
jgi:hypothetical protein